MATNPAIDHQHSAPDTPFREISHIIIIPNSGFEVGTLQSSISVTRLEFVASLSQGIWRRSSFECVW
ncbi:hypothetical protein PoMZ_12741 [Pyricularia oryzae]|uniref:Uncharacterized protein n=1 Tax=Pyricularia oryzae TaxID=318829 RepID=A0A4P7NTF8_PYROR|nr:hypothetical protein PoMZ_12741 [Pyricularia oryzae]